ncbi:MAG: hypothetical protein ACLTM7_01700 [Streptococcus sp.]
MKAQGAQSSPTKIQKIELETPKIANDRIMRLIRTSAFKKFACLKTNFKKV